MKEEAILSAPGAPAKTGDGLLTSAERVSTIDILRALTMVLMIFVNDLWSLTNIPAWIGHVDAGVDGIGLADVVFPAFLFIVGLSIPYAMETRRNKGDTDWQLVKHVLWRTMALLIMGVFLVNGESINASATGMPRYVWAPLCCLCFILMWNSYAENAKPWLVNAVRIIAGSTLIFLAFIYRGGPDDGIRYFGPQWWGILGLIGWAYLVSALVGIWAKGSFKIVAGAWIFFSLLSMVSHAGLIPDIFSFVPPAISGGTIVGLTLGGVLTSMIFRYYHHRKDNKGLTLTLLIFAALLIGLSVVTRPYWGLAKLGATPAWLFLCSAFTILGFLAVYWIADVNRKEQWFSMIRPAGTATLLCYLTPYFPYFTTRVLGIGIPEFMLSGPLGLLKSFLFALLCVLITAGLIRAGIRMRL
jgi:heparan-alpha-glucosaminide N-acetyltransferase